MKKQFVKPEIKGIRLRNNILAGSGNSNPDPGQEGCAVICNAYDKDDCTGFGSIKCPYNTDANALGF